MNGETLLPPDVRRIYEDNIDDHAVRNLVQEYMILQQQYRALNETRRIQISPAIDTVFTVYDDQGAIFNDMSMRLKAFIAGKISGVATELRRYAAAKQRPRESGVITGVSVDSGKRLLVENTNGRTEEPSSEPESTSGSGTRADRKRGTAKAES